MKGSLYEQMKIVGEELERRGLTAGLTPRAEDLIDAAIEKAVSHAAEKLSLGKDKAQESLSLLNRRIDARRESSD